MTFGTSLGLTIAGAAVAGAGGATNLGSYITKKVLEKKKREQLMRLGREEVQVCKDLDRELQVLGKVR